jgi:hypothetical protein
LGCKGVFMRQGRGEIKFQLRENYDLLIGNAKKENEKMNSRPGFVAIIIFFTAPFISSLATDSNREFFTFLLVLAVASYLYFKLHYRDLIAINEENIKSWESQKLLQEEYASYLYDLEDTNAKNSMGFIPSTLKKRMEENLRSLENKT